MPVTLILCALLAAAPFWETKAPREWTAAELTDMLNRSPWAQPAIGSGFPAAGVQTYLSTAEPMRQAEAELLRRRAIAGRAPEPSETEEFRHFIEQQHSESIVLTVRFTDSNALADAKELKRMEEECIMKVGRKKYKITGHFPPTPSDPYLRLVFPRQVAMSDKIVEFDLYLPGTNQPYRIAEYVIKDLMYRGKLEL
jgi:hypothetical protein